MQTDNVGRPPAAILTVNSWALALAGLVVVGFLISRLAHGASLAAGGLVEWLAVSAIVKGVPTLWPLPEWLVPTLGLAGLIGTGLDLTAWRNMWGRPRGNGIWFALAISVVSLVAGTLGFLEISRLSIADAGWSFRATGATIGAIISATTGIGALGGWWRLLILDRAAFPSLSQRQSLEDGLRCIGQSVVIALMLGVIVFAT